MDIKYFVTLVIIGFLFLVLFGMWGCPQYNVWQQGLKGEAELRRAQQNRKIRVEEARARLESAKFLNQAEVERAKGTAEANRIVDSSLTEQYLRYHYINEILVGSNTDIIYVPTEATLPILEATRK